MALIADRVIITRPPCHHHSGGGRQKAGLRFLGLHSAFAIHSERSLAGAFCGLQVGFGAYLELLLRRPLGGGERSLRHVFLQTNHFLRQNDFLEIEA
jgi:hypothetical protein